MPPAPAHTDHISPRAGVMVPHIHALHGAREPISHRPVFPLPLASVGLPICRPYQVGPATTHCPLPLGKVIISSPSVGTEQKGLLTPSQASPQPCIWWGNLGLTEKSKERLHQAFHTGTGGSCNMTMAAAAQLGRAPCPSYDSVANSGETTAQAQGNQRPAPDCVS